VRYGAAGCRNALRAHLFPSYWNLALQHGADPTEQPLSGDVTFVETVMYLSVNHEIAPTEQANGYGGVPGCTDCHTCDQIDWTALGWSEDPITGGERP
jgi:hypothetical protein